MFQPHLKEKTKKMKREIHTLYLAARDPRVPGQVKFLTALLIGYALSPVDLIPDFIPILGQLDDLIIVSAGIGLILKMVPKDVMQECRRRAAEEPVHAKTKWIITSLIILLWAAIAYLLLRLIWPILL